jgi:hypothetical protein
MRFLSLFASAARFDDAILGRAGCGQISRPQIGVGVLRAERDFGVNPPSTRRNDHAMTGS